MKIHPHLQMVDLHGHHVVDKQDEGVVVDQWNIGQNQMINGIIMMIDLVDRKKKNFFYLKFFIFLRGKKVHRIVMNQINNVDGDRMQLCLIVILIYDVHKLNEIVRLVCFFVLNKINFSVLGMPEWMDDNNDGDNQLSTATFEKDGTFTELSSLRQNSNEQKKVQTQSSTDETSSRGNIVSYKKFFAKFFFLFIFLFQDSIKTTRN